MIISKQRVSLLYKFEVLIMYNKMPSNHVSSNLTVCEIIAYIHKLSCLIQKCVVKNNIELKRNFKKRMNKKY